MAVNKAKAIPAVMPSRQGRNKVSLFTALNYFVMLCVGLVTLFPFYITAINSIAPPEDFLLKEIILWPSKFDISYYQLILNGDSDLFLAYRTTIIVTVVGTAINMALTSITAFALAQKRMPYRLPITFLMVFTMFFSGGMIPSFILVQNLGMLNTIWSMIIPGAISTIYVLLLRNFFMTIPADLSESASIDGCSELRIFLRIILPLSLPAMATFTLFYAVEHWNDFYSGMLYVTDYRLQPLQVYLRQVLYDATIRADPETMQKLLGDGTLKYDPPSDAMKAATVMAATIPIICVYPFLQKYFVKGMLMGSLKG